MTGQPAPPPIDPAHRWSRRGLLAAGSGSLALLALGAGGCSVNNPFDTEDTPVEEALPDLAPDVGVAVQAVVAIRETAARVAATSRRHPGQADVLQGLAAMHRAHLDALVAAVPNRVALPEPTSPVTVPARPVVARRRLIAREEALRASLVRFALQAESGTFARLLGSCAASISQHLVVLA